MKVGDKYKDKVFGWGVISEITTQGFTVKFYSRTVTYHHIRNEKAVSIVVWSVIIIVCFMSFLGWLI